MSSVVTQLLLALGLGLLAMPANACMCVALALESLVDKADTILVVRIVRTEDAMAAAGESVWAMPAGDAPSFAPGSSYGTRAEFSVLKTLKATGPVPKALRTGYVGGDDCGVDLVPGSNYLILTDANGVVSACSGSRRVGFQDGINCPTQAWLAAVEQRIADRSSEIVPLGDAPTEIDGKVIDALKAGRSAFDAGCELTPPGGGNVQ